MNRLLVLILLLSGCVDTLAPIDKSYVFENNQIMYIGDSNCAAENWEFEMAWHIAGIDNDCIPGRRLMEIDTLPDSSIVFLALGTNDAKHTNTTQTDYGQRLTQLIDSTDAVVYCVLPTLNESFNGYSVDLIQSEMLSRCANVINPDDYGIMVNYGDGIHWDDLDHLNFVDAIVDRL